MDINLSQQTLHPVLSISLPQRLVSTGACTANLLVHLPPSLFFDPYTSHALKRNPAVRSSSLLGVLELEQPVGWSRRKTVAQSRSWWELPHEGEQVPIDSTTPDEHTSVLIALQPAASTSASVQVNVPLHARYSPPLPSQPLSLVESAEELLHQLSPKLAASADNLLARIAGKQILSRQIRRKERYYTQRLEKPQLFLTCNDNEKPASGWYQTEDRNLFPVTHDHLSLPATGQTIYMPLISSTSSSAPLSISLPRPSADLAPLVQFTTITSVILLTAWILTTLFSSTNRVKAHEQKQLLRSVTKND